MDAAQFQNVLIGVAIAGFAFSLHFFYLFIEPIYKVGLGKWGVVFAHILLLPAFFSQLVPVVNKPTCLERITLQV